VINKKLEPIRKHGQLMFYVFSCVECGCGFKEKNLSKTNFDFTCPCCSASMRCEINQKELTDNQLQYTTEEFDHEQD